MVQIITLFFIVCCINAFKLQLFHEWSQGKGERAEILLNKIQPNLKSSQDLDQTSFEGYSGENDQKSLGNLCTGFKLFVVPAMIGVVDGTMPYNRAVDVNCY